MSPPTTLYLGSKVEVVDDAFNFNNATVNLSSAIINYGSNGIDSKVSSLLTDVAAIHSTISADEATVQTIKDTIAGINTMIATDETGAAALNASVGALRSDVSTVQSKVDRNFSNTTLFSNSNYDLGKRIDYVDSSKTQLINAVKTTVENDCISKSTSNQQSVSSQLIANGGLYTRNHYVDNLRCWTQGRIICQNTIDMNLSLIHI